MQRKTLISIAVSACVAVLFIVAVFEPTRIIRGMFFGEAFFRGRPTSYWREVIRADGQSGKVQAETSRLLNDGDAIGVLRECLTDADPNVRWPAVYLFHQVGFAYEVEPAVREALNDSNVDVQIAALRVLGWLRREALSAIPRLAELASDSDVNIRSAAHHALWEIDQEAALNAGGWKEFASKTWQFTVTMPGSPQEKQKFVDTPFGQVPSHSFSVSFGLAQCVVGVAEYAQQVLDEVSEEDRYDSAAKVTADALGGALSRYDPIEQHGHSGREQIIDLEGKYILHTRVFLIGNRSYQINISYPSGTMSPEAIAYLMDSFRIQYTPR